MECIVVFLCLVVILSGLWNCYLQFKYFNTDKLAYTLSVICDNLEKKLSFGAEENSRAMSIWQEQLKNQKDSDEYNFQMEIFKLTKDILSLCEGKKLSYMEQEEIKHKFWNAYDYLVKKTEKEEDYNSQINSGDMDGTLYRGEKFPEILPGDVDLLTYEMLNS